MPSVWNIIRLSEVIRALPEHEAAGEVNLTRGGIAAWLCPALSAKVPSGPAAKAVLGYVYRQLVDRGERSVEIGDDFREWASGRGYAFSEDDLTASLEAMFFQIYARDGQHEYHGTAIQSYERCGGVAILGVTPDLYVATTGYSPPPASGWH